MDNSYESGAHCVYLLQYHIIWCPRYRFHVLTDGTDTILKDILTGICMENRFVIKAMEVMPDHIHLFLSAPQTVAPSDIVRILKAESAKRLFAAVPALRQRYWKNRLWSRGYFISTVGHISERTVTQYIENQKKGGLLK